MNEVQMKKPDDLTERQWECVIYTRSLPRMIDGIGAVTHVQRCKAMGYLTSEPHKPRSLRLTEKALKLFERLR